jgi:hypothetical protein
METEQSAHGHEVDEVSHWTCSITSLETFGSYFVTRVREIQIQ